MRSPLTSSPFKYSTRSQFEVPNSTKAFNQFTSPVVSLKSRNQTNVSSFNDSLLNFRKDVNPLQFKNSESNSNLNFLGDSKFNSTDYSSKSYSTKSPKKIQRSFGEPAQSSPNRQRKNKGGLHLDEIFQTNKVVEQKASKGVLYGQMKIDSNFRQKSPQQFKRLNTFEQHQQNTYQNPYMKQPAIQLQENKMSHSREKIQRFKSQDSNLDLQLRIQRNSLEKRVHGDQSWLKEFEGLKSQSPSNNYNRNGNGGERIESKISVHDVMKLTSKLGGITISEVPKLSSSYLSELVSLQDTLGRIIKQSNKTRY